jgi:diguanylate cyclase (GGDEF)-like protein
MNKPLSIVNQLILPLLVISAFFTTLFYQDEIPKQLFSFLPELFFIMTIIVLAVSWHFNRNQFGFILVPLILFFTLINYIDFDNKTLLINIFSLFFPIHLFIFSLFKERGILSLWGVLKIVFVIVELSAVYYIFITYQSDIKILFSLNLFESSLTSWTRLSDVTLVTTFIIMIVFSLLALFHYQMSYHASFIVITFLSSVAIHFKEAPTSMALAYLSILIISFSVLIKESYRLAFFDQLTELPGRRALIEDMAKLGRSYTLAMIDIDHFKKFNDTYGHDTGDEVLKMVAAKLGDIAGGGKAYRYGGEEFTILFPSKSVADSFVYVDAVRETVATSGFVVRNKKSKKTIFVNISAGIVEKSSKDKDPMAVMKRADNALYKAKKAGRNKVIKA